MIHGGPRALDSTSVSKKTNYYGPERLVAAANMFDLLPADAVPGKTSLSVELQDAKAKALEAFEDLPESIDKNMVTSALGRLGQPSLPKKSGTVRK